MPRRIVFFICKMVTLCLLWAAPTLAQSGRAEQEPTWLWVKDDHTHLGIAGVSVEIGPGRACLGPVKFADAKWTAHYVTGPAGRVLTHGLPGSFSCRVTLNRRELPVKSTAGEIRIRPWTGPKWVRSENARETTIYVDIENLGFEGVELDYWRTTDDPTQFRAYVQDLDVRQLISGVKVMALRTGITTASDANGLFTLEVPASYRKGKTPPAATETLVFSKPGYRRFEYRDLILNPGVNSLEILLEKGTEIGRASCRERV